MKARPRHDATKKADGNMRDQLMSDVGGVLDLQESLMRDLERQSADEIKKLRAHDRIDARFTVTLYPANASDRVTLPNEGHTSDISRGGCGAVFEAPVGVGDVYRIEFEEGADLPTVFGRCMRCCMIRSDVFEVGIQFFNEVTLPGTEDAPEEDLLA